MTIAEIPQIAQTKGPASPLVRAHLATQPMPANAITLDRAGVLGAWQLSNRLETIQHCIDQLEESGALRNLRRVLDPGAGDFTGMWFADSDVYKTLEAIGWELGNGADAKMLAFLEETTTLLERVQQDDGYLNSWFQTVKAGERWSDLSWGHEMYCAGHLVQAAVAVHRTTGDQRLLNVAQRFADHIVDRFGGPANTEVCGHPEIETALVELYRETGRRSYLDLASAMIDRRGRQTLSDEPFGHAYFQDHLPIRDAFIATGHAVRQLYLATGVMDVFIETGDSTLLTATKLLWKDAIDSKTYITGGQGSRHRDESFGDAYELPSDRAYAESCASIANFMLSWRLLLATGDAKYAAEMERLIFNAIPATVSLSGCEFFYSNPLHLRSDHDGSQEDAPSSRLPWYRCACCPPNLARLISALGAYTATSSENGIDLQVLTSGTFSIASASSSATITVRTSYPQDGGARITIDESTGFWSLGLRTPEHVENFSISINGESRDISETDGYIRIEREWTPGDELAVDFDLKVRAIHPHPRIDAVRGCLAIARGPIVYCVEQKDMPDGTSIEDLSIDADGIETAKTVRRTDLNALCLRLRAQHRPAEQTVLYQSTPDRRPETGAPVEIIAIPYALWANGSPTAMRVWIPETRKE